MGWGVGGGVRSQISCFSSFSAFTTQNELTLTYSHASAENAALGVPLLILSPIPGQEQRNADVLLETGGCLKINDLPLIPSRLDYVLGGGGGKIDEMRRGMEKLAKPLSAFTVADDILRG